jgi:hypothetical protein
MNSPSVRRRRRLTLGGRHLQPEDLVAFGAVYFGQLAQQQQQQPQKQPQEEEAAREECGADQQPSTSDGGAEELELGAKCSDDC